MGEGKEEELAPNEGRCLSSKMETEKSSQSWGGGGAETNNLEQHTPCLVERKTPLYKEKEYRKPTCLVLPHKCLEV